MRETFMKQPDIFHTQTCKILPFWGELISSWHYIFNHELNYSVANSEDQMKSHTHTKKSLFDHYIHFCSIQIEVMNFTLKSCSDSV